VKSTRRFGQGLGNRSILRFFGFFFVFQVLFFQQSDTPGCQPVNFAQYSAPALMTSQTGSLIYDLRRKSTVTHKRFAIWQAAIAGVAVGLLASFWAVYNGVFFEREIPARFLIGFMGGTLLAYLLGDLMLYLLRRLRERE
jgi:hypothetical protein